MSAQANFAASLLIHAAALRAYRAKKETARLFWTVPDLILCLVENSSDRDRRSVIRIGNLDSGLLRARMHDLAISNVDSHMSAVADDVAGLCAAQAAVDFCSHTSVCRRGMRKGHTEVLIYAHHETGAVRTVSKARPAIFIGIANELKREFRNRTSGRGCGRMGSRRAGRLNGFCLSCRCTLGRGLLCAAFHCCAF